MTQRLPPSRSIVVERTLPHPPEKVWRALTDSRLIADWLMPNDFRAEVGHRFTFRTRPVGSWDGVVHCEVLDVVPCERLRYSWIGGSDDNGAFGSRLESEVTWTLAPVADGTHVRMEHAGFGPGNEFAYDAMDAGWGRVLERIDTLLADLDHGQAGAVATDADGRE